MADVHADSARLITLFIGCVLYGILLTTFAPCIRSLLFSPTENVLMFLVSSFGIVLSLQDVINIFIDYDDLEGLSSFTQP
ncbi:hypothetical protein DFH07DRAFT_963764 [Mycena maculata]|uniref:Uncharacterized protein n=1 Tax=Mycena maculata TaxID=230809 RepID=A0AAD7ILI0_9AGAR|nr:hypothetical protein DFH07DRAFT_963764 [Mycena maculata]